MNNNEENPATEFNKRMQELSSLRGKIIELAIQIEAIRQKLERNKEFSK